MNELANDVGETAARWRESLNPEDEHINYVPAELEGPKWWRWVKRFFGGGGDEQGHVD